VTDQPPLQFRQQFARRHVDLFIRAAQWFQTDTAAGNLVVTEDRGMKYS
jgi:3'-phosphoadenosine 5'-phosphosulfate (PAPS) 3'-phosphatase